MKKYRFLLISVMCFILIGCGSGDDSNRAVGSSSQTIAEIESLGLPTTTIATDRLFVLRNPSNPSISFSVTSVELESAVQDGAVRLTVGSPMRISVGFENYFASDPNSAAGMRISFDVANYTAEQLVSDTRPPQNAFLPIGTWVEQVNGPNGSVTALCRAVNGDFGGPAFNCQNTFDVQGFGRIQEGLAEIGATELHLLIEIFGTTDLTGGVVAGGTDDGPVSIVTSVPIVLE